MRNKFEIKRQGKRNQIVYDAPKLGEGQTWRVDGYLFGRNVRQCPRPFEDWSELQYIGKSNGVYQFIGDGSKVLICSIQIQ